MGSIVRTIVSEAIASKLSDPRISPLTSVTRVEMSVDLRVAKVFVSVLGTEAESRRTLAGLHNACGRIQRIVAKNLSVRSCPEVRIELDDSLKTAAETIEIINRTVASPVSTDDLPGDLPGEDDSDGANA